MVLGVFGILILAFLRVQVRISCTVVGKNAVAAMAVALFFGLLPINVSAAVVEQKEAYRLYWKLGHSVPHEIHLVSKQKKSHNLKWITKLLVCEYFALRCMIGVENAAHCALLCGLAETALAALMDFARLPGRPVVVPAFNANTFRLDFTGIVIVKPEQSIKALPIRVRALTTTGGRI